MSLKNSLTRMTKSLHILADLYDCGGDETFFTHKGIVKRKVLAMVKRAGFRIVASRFHKFGANAGITGVIIVSESHLTLHTWPEKGFVNLDVFFCNYTQDNTKKVRNILREFKTLYNPGKIRKREVWRD